MTFNKNAENVCCWKCQHFQRYDSQAGTEQQTGSCAGECRYQAPVPAVSSVQTTNGQNTAYKNGQFPVIQDGGREWCGNFARSLEKNLPPVPPQDSNGNCIYQPKWPDDWVTFNTSPWSKMLKAGYTATPGHGSVCCFNCDHFAHQTNIYKGEVTRAGNCKRNTPRIGYSGNDYDGNSIFEAGVFPYVRDAVCEWCSEYERTQEKLDDPVYDWACGIRGIENLFAQPGSTIEAVTASTAKTTTKKTK